MSRSCHRATFSSPAWAFPRRTRARPEICSALIGLRLWGIAEEPFWPARKGSWHLADLGPLQVADLDRQPLEAGAGERDAEKQLGVAVAGDDLRGDVPRADPQARQYAGLELRVRRGVGPDGPREGTDGDLVEGLGEPQGVAVGLEGEAGQLDAERRRLGVDAVGPPDAERLGLLAGPRGERRDQLLRALQRRPPRRLSAAAPGPCPGRRRRSVRSGSSGPPRRPIRPGCRRRPPCRGRSAARAR